MGSSLKRSVEWVTAFATVFSLYAHTAFDLPSSVVTPISAAVIAGGLFILALLSISTVRLDLGTSALRELSTICLIVALFGFGLSTVWGMGERQLTLNDLGLLGIQVGVPILLWFMRSRTEFINSLLWVCIGFALMDAVANVFAWRGLIDLPTLSGRTDALDPTGYRVRYPGLTGNTHAGGLVAMLAICALSCRLYRAKIFGRLVYLALIAVVFVSLDLIDARRYLGMAAVGFVVIAIPLFWRVPPILTIAGIAGSAVYAAFTNFFDYEDDLRGRLMTDGWQYASQMPFLGQGVFYRDLTGIRPDYASLSSAGVTESGILDLALSYGVASTVIFVLAAMFGVSARRSFQAVPVVLVTLLTAELAFGDSLTGFLGSVAFFACLVWVQRDEVGDAIRGDDDRRAGRTDDPQDLREGSA